jgi:hypothetical protein
MSHCSSSTLVDSRVLKGCVGVCVSIVLVPY